MINSSANVFVSGDFNVHHKNWRTYSAVTDRQGELCYNFSISNDLTQMVNFPTQIPVTLTVLLFWGYFFLLMLQWLQRSTMAFPPLGNTDHIVVLVFIDFPTNSKQAAPFHHVA